MMLTLGGAPVGNISGEKGDGGGRGSYPKAWSSKTVLSDKDGKPAAIVTREVTVTGKTAIQDAKGHVAAKLSFATIYGAQPRCDGQPPAAGVTAPGDVPMYAWAQLKPWAGLKSAPTPVRDETHAKAGKAHGPNFCLFPLGADGVSFAEQPTMLFVNKRAMVENTSYHVLSPDAADGLAVCNPTSITVAPGVDACLVALALMEFRLWTDLGPSAWMWTPGGGLGVGQAM